MRFWHNEKGNLVVEFEHLEHYNDEVSNMVVLISRGTQALEHTSVGAYANALRDVWESGIMALAYDTKQKYVETSPYRVRTTRRELTGRKENPLTQKDIDEITIKTEIPAKIKLNLHGEKLQKGELKRERNNNKELLRGGDKKQ